MYQVKQKRGKERIQMLRQLFKNQQRNRDVVPCVMRQENARMTSIALAVIDRQVKKDFSNRYYWSTKFKENFFTLNNMLHVDKEEFSRDKVIRKIQWRDRQDSEDENSFYNEVEWVDGLDRPNLVPFSWVKNNYPDVLPDL